MPIVRFPALMKFYVDNQSEFPVEGATVAELIDNVLERYPTLKPHLLETGGNLRRHFNIFVNGEHIRELGNLYIDKSGKISKITDVYYYENHEIT
jgi:molybdopterin converting factor small subunit